MLVLSLFIVVGVVLSLPTFSHSQSNYDFANPFIGSGGPGFGYGGVNPGAQYPFGALRLGPDTSNTIADISFRHFSGYNYFDDTIRAFSHTHLVGAGTDDLGNFGVMPVRMEKDDHEFVHNRWWSTFNKSNEVAHPGYYSVYLDEPKVQAEMIAIGTMAGVHRYSWKDLRSRAGLVLNMCHAAKLHLGSENPCQAASVQIDENDANVFSGSINMSGSFTDGMGIYIYGEIVTESPMNKGVKQWKWCKGEKSFCSVTNSATAESGILFGVASFHDVNPNDEAFAINVRVGISFISTELAKQNLQDAMGSMKLKSFSSLHDRTVNVWSEALSNIDLVQLEGDSDAQTLLHSANYRSQLTPTIYTESGGIYVGLDKKIHNATAERLALYGSHADPAGKASNQYEFFSDFSLWDTFRTVHPWHLLLNEDISIGFARSLGEMTVQQSAFPRWVLANQEASCMLGEHGSSFIIEAVDAGFRNEFDLANIQKYLLMQLTQSGTVNGRSDLQNYLTIGYVTQDASGDSTCETLTNAFDDYLLGKISQFVNDTSSADAAFARSKNYQNVWSPDRLFFCPKYADGTMDCPDSPTGPKSWNEFREGDALHWMWFVPHDVQGLISLFPSPAAFDQALSDFFVNHIPYHEKFNSAAPNPYYWAGNEHDFLASYLFNYGPNCTNTQYWSRLANQMHFSNTPHGIPGNEDYGSMATWLLFSSLGIFPNAGTSQFLVGSPRVQSAKLKLRHWNSDYSTLEIITYGNSAENVFVEKLLVNGVEYKQPFIERSVLANPSGVKLEFYMHSYQEFF